MRYWISITTYLWKNIWSHWFESPLSAWSKIVLTFLLSLLALILVGGLRQTERVLDERLQRQDVLSATVSIQFSSLGGVISLDQSLYREAILKRLLDTDEVELLRKPYALVQSPESQRQLPVMVTHGEPSFWKKSWGDYRVPQTYLFYRLGVKPLRKLSLNGVTLTQFKTIPFPPELQQLADQDYLVLLPHEAGHGLLEEGFSEHLIFKARDQEHLKRSLKFVSGYLKAEGLRCSVTSSLKILNELEQFSQVLKVLRVGLVVVLIIIIAIVLGNQALLEFREQQYHFALLRSFGVPYVLILVTDLVEKLLLASVGFLGAYFCIPLLTDYGRKTVASLQNMEVLLISEDLFWIAGGVVVGVLLSWIFLAFTSKKAVGLVLS